MRTPSIRSVLVFVAALSAGEGKIVRAAPINDDATPMHEGGSRNKDATIDFDFPEPTEIVKIVRRASLIFNRNIIFDTTVTGSVQILAPGKVTLSEAYQIFISALDSANLAIVESGPVMKLIRKMDAKKAELEIVDSADARTQSERMVTQVVRLKYANAKTMIIAIANLLPTGSAVDISETNALIINETGFNLRRVINIINELDRRGTQREVSFFPVRYHQAKEIAEKARELFKIENKRAAEKFQVVVDDRSNSIVFLGDMKATATMRGFVSDLDIAPMEKNTGSRIHVRALEFSEAKKMSALISAIQNPSKKTNDAPKIVADDANNALLITASSAGYRAINEIVRKLDVKRPQVFIQLEILDLSGTHGFTAGSSLLLGSGKSDGTGTKVITGWQAQDASAIVLAGSAAGTTASSTAAQNVASAFGSDLTVGVLAGQPVDVAGVGKLTPTALLKFIKADTQTKVLASPFLLTSDNEEASISVGQTVYYRASGVSGEGTVAGRVDKEKVALTVTIKPEMTDSEYLMLTSEINNDTITGYFDGTPAVANRKTKQTMMLRSGQTAVIAGLQNNEEKESISRVPFLSDIPLIGWLFQSQQKSSVESKLAILMTPYIVHGANDLKAIYEKKMKDSELENDQLERNRHHEPY